MSKHIEKFPFKNMNLILIHDNKDSTGKDNGLLQSAICSEPLRELIFIGLHENGCYPEINRAMIAIPNEWCKEPSSGDSQITYYDNMVSVENVATKKICSWFVIYNGNYITNVNRSKLNKILENTFRDMITINVSPSLSSYRENIRITSGGNVAGFRRLYSDSALPVTTPTDWPHMVFIKPDAFNKILLDNKLLTNFSDLINRCSSQKLSIDNFKLGGNILNLETEVGLLSLLRAKQHSLRRNSHRNNNHMHTISAGAKIFGNVILGNNVQIDNNAVIVGPTILSDNVKIFEGAVVRGSVIGPDLSIPKAGFLQNTILLDTKSGDRNSSVNSDNPMPPLDFNFTKDRTIKSHYRIWPKFSYAGCIKRIVDIIVALVVLILFAPIFPIIAIVIKLIYPGTVFFKDKRQGLYGKEFNCLKFRTMIAGADKIQERLRFKNQVDGPQFKMEKDPRITIVGKFLRDTFIDEIPQFINILLGQMSVIGPRPSPKSENSLCPAWREARFSVRPGITGLWQIKRTRKEGQDFQEWIRYDTEYIKNLSLRLDLIICLQTTKKLFVNFFDQF